LDIRISQEIGLFGDHQLQLFLDVENALNLFGHNKNVRNYNRSGDVPEALRTLELDDGSTDVYEVTDIFFEETNSIDTDDTVYRVQLGISYRF
jgi:hypothetical protein